MSPDYRDLSLRTIAEMASRYGVTMRTLRFYEQRGLISPIRSGMLRLYTPEDDIRLQIIQKGKKLGFSLQEIENILSSKRGRDHKQPSGDDIPLERLLTRTQIEDRIVVLQGARDRVASAIGELEAMRRGKLRQRRTQPRVITPKCKIPLDLAKERLAFSEGRRLQVETSDAQDVTGVRGHPEGECWAALGGSTQATSATRPPWTSGGNICMTSSTIMASARRPRCRSEAP